MTVETQERNLIPALIISLLIHLVTLKALEFLPKNFLTSSRTPQIKEKRSIQIKSISREELKKYRTAGVKNGKKTFSMPLKNQSSQKITPIQKSKLPPTIKVQTEKIPSKKISKAKKVVSTQQKELSLNALRIKSKTGVETKVVPSKMKTLEQEKSSSSKIEVTTQNPVNYERTREAQTDVLKQLATLPDNATVLRKTGFNMQLEPPEGVSENELNTMEKIYYSFQKRTFQSYVGSFLKTYKQTLIDHPSVKSTLQNDTHNLAARVIFDSEGNIVSIKILRSSHNDEIHNMFEETLKEIRKLPNPPKDLVENTGEFTIYYQLKIN